MYYSVIPIFCGYGVYRHTDNERELIVICINSDNANMIAEILNADRRDKIWEPTERVKE